MFKKIVSFTAILVATSGAAWAASDTIYVGMNAGLNRTTARVVDVANASTHFSANGMTGGFFGGYGVAVDRFVYLGGELFVNDSSTSTIRKVINVDTSGDTTNAKIVTKYSYGASFMPGLLLGQSGLLYGRLGMVKTRFDMNQTTVPAGSASNTSVNVISGAQVGLGIQSSISNKFGIRLDYSYAIYRSFKAFGNKVSPRNSLLDIGLVYNFDGA